MSPPSAGGAWFRSYLPSLLQRDIRDLAHIEGLTEMPRPLGLLAARSTSVMNMSELSRATGIAHSTLRRCPTLLEATFIRQPLPAWSADLGRRFVKSPKVHLVDSGLAPHLRGDTDPSELAASPAPGPLLESFVLQEIRRQRGWSRRQAAPDHFRTTVGREVDIVLEHSREFIGRRAEPNDTRAAVHAGRSSALQNSRLFRKLLRAQAPF